jgi:hypothetical protein
MAKRRRKSYGYISVKSRSRKISRHRNKFQNGRAKSVHVRVFVQRGVNPSNTSDRPGYWAWACTAKSGRSGENRGSASLAVHRRKACGEDAYGRTPTAAVKKALINLGKKRELK